MKALAVLLAGALSMPAHARPDFEAFAAGFIGAVIIASMNKEEKEPAPEPVKKAPRQVYLEHCVGYGFSLGYCKQIWDGKDATRDSEPGVVINPIK